MIKKMIILQFNLKRFNKPTLTDFFYQCKPALILYKGFVVRVIGQSYGKPNYNNIKELESISVKGWQIMPFEKIHENYYVTGWNKEK